MTRAPLLGFSQLPGERLAGVEHQADVHGFKPGIDLFAAVVFLEIGTSTTFWQVIAVGGGSATGEQAQQELQELQSINANLEFL